jgi:cell division protein FtsW
MSDLPLFNTISNRMDSAEDLPCDSTLEGYRRSVAIVGIAIGLMAIGTVMTFSAVINVDREVWSTFGGESAWVRQLIYVVGGLTAMLIMTRVPYRVFFAGRGWMSMVLLVASLLVLGLVFVPGVGLEVNGARRWVRIPGADVRFQPSELVKVALPLFLAGWMSYRANVRRFWTGLLPAVAVIGICVAAVGLEDFGTAALIGAVAGTMLLMGGARWWHAVVMAAPAVAAFGVLLVSRAHRIQRILIFLDPWSDPRGEGYQLIQSLSTMASGGWWGRGLGGGFVKGYLPEARNDFIFAVICEELGIIGAMAVIGLFIALMWLSLQVIRRHENPVGRLLALGIAMTLGLQAAINIAVVTASVPTKGISLPLVSAGGSGVIFLGALVGVLANIARSDKASEDWNQDG